MTLMGGQIEGRLREDGTIQDPPLLGVACSYHWHVAKFVISQGANLQSRWFPECAEWVSEDWFRQRKITWTPLHIAAYNGDPFKIQGEKTWEEQQSITELLINAGAQLEAQDHDLRTPLHVAAIRGHKVTVQLLIKAGANIEAKNSNGCTPLHLAVQKDHQDIVKILLSNGAQMETDTYLVKRSADSANLIEPIYEMWKKCKKE